MLCATVGNSVKRRNSKKSDVDKVGVIYLGTAVDSVRTVTKGVTHAEVHMRQSRRGV